MHFDPIQAATETESWFPVIDPKTYEWDEHERFIAQFANDRRLSPKELGALAQRMIDSIDPKEQDELWEAITRGWYGGVTDA